MRILFKKAKKQLKNKIRNVFYRTYIKEPIVVNGPFKGLRYPALQSVGSAFLPKLLGSYESELHEYLYTLSQHNNIIDIGSAEGYYAVGLAKLNHQTKIIAFERSLKGQSLCKEMAHLNNVSERITQLGECSIINLKSILRDVKAGGIICDCEGGEMHLLDPLQIPDLANFELIVELHKIPADDILSIFKNRFMNTHNVEFIEIRKHREKDKFGFKNVVAFIWNIVSAEGRSSSLGWFYATPKR